MMGVHGGLISRTCSSEYPRFSPSLDVQFLLFEVVGLGYRFRRLSLFTVLKVIHPPNDAHPAKGKFKLNCIYVLVQFVAHGNTLR